MKCNRCDKEFSSKQMRDYHCNNVVCGAKDLGRLRTTFICRICDKMFTTNQSLQKHQNNLVCVKDSKGCQHCHKTFSTKQKLQQHISNKTCLKDRSLECAFCGKTLSDRRRYQGHLKICKLKEKEMSYFISFGHRPSEDELISLLRRRKALNQILPGFELIERVTWSDRDHWEEVCGHCKAKKGDPKHVRTCLVPKRTCPTFI